MLRECVEIVQAACGPQAETTFDGKYYQLSARQL